MTVGCVPVSRRISVSSSFANATNNDKPPEIQTRVAERAQKEELPVGELFEQALIVRWHFQLSYDAERDETSRL